MAYTHTTRSTNIYVGTSDATMEAKLNNLTSKVAKWLSGEDGFAVPTFSATVDGETKQLTGIKFAGLGDTFRLGFYPYEGGSATPTDGAKLGMTMFYRNSTTTFGGAMTYNNDEFICNGAVDKYLILNNNSGSGLSIREDTFTNKTNSKVLKRIEFAPLVGGNEDSNARIYFIFAPLSNVFKDEIIEGYCFGSPQYGLNNRWKRHTGTGYTTYVLSRWAPFQHTKVPNGKYTMAIGACPSDASIAYGTQSVTIMWNVIDDSTLYNICMNGAIMNPEFGSTITISGVKFMSLGDTMFIRLT